MALIKVVSYYHQCDACGKKIPSEGTEPQTGVVGRLDYPDSAHGEGRRNRGEAYSAHPDSS
jgi:hypothetical protein